MTSLFDGITLESLRRRTSTKWRAYAPDAVPMWVAEMDLVPPPAAVEVIVRAMTSGDTGYPDRSRYVPALARFARRHWDWDVPTAGATLATDVMTGVAAVLASATAPGDAVVVPTPVYPPFLTYVAEAGRRAVEVPLDAADRLDLDAIDRAITDTGATAVLLCSPHNPTGTVHRADELRELARICRDRAAVIADEIHAPLSREPFTPYLTVDPAGIVVTSASKAYHLAAMKAAVVIAGPQWRGRALPPSLPDGASHFGVLSQVAAWDEGDAWLAAVNRDIAANATRLAQALTALAPEVGYRPPAATYLAWLDFRATPLGHRPAAQLLESGRLALNAGETFGAAGHGFARLNLAAPPSLIDHAAAVIATVAGRPERTHSAAPVS